MGREFLDIVTKALDSKKIKYTVDTAKLVVKVIYLTKTLDLNAFIHTYEDRSALALDCLSISSSPHPPGRRLSRSSTTSTSDSTTDASSSRTTGCGTGSTSSPDP